MKKTMKQMLTALLTVAMIASMLVVPGVAANNAAGAASVNYYEVTLDTDAVTVYANGTDTKVVNAYAVTDDANVAVYAVSADTGVATATVDGDKVTIAGAAEGETYIYIVAADAAVTTVAEAQAAGDKMKVVAVTVKAAEQPQPPVPQGPTTGVFTLDIGEEVAAGKLTAGELAGSDPEPANQIKGLGTEGLFTLIVKKTGGAAIDTRNSKTEFEDSYAGTHNYKTGGNVKKLEDMVDEGKCITFTTGDKATVKVWWCSGSSKGSTLAVANQIGEAVPTLVTATAEKSAQNVGVITVFENVPAGVNYLYSPDGTARFFKVVVAVGDSTIPGGGDEPGPGPVDPEKPADVAALNTAIADAKALADVYDVKPDTTVASNVKDGAKYVLESDKKALDDAIAAAEAVAAKTDATQAEVDAAVAALNDAVAAFNAAVKTGTKTTTGGSNHGSSSRPGDRGEQPTKPTIVANFTDVPTDTWFADSVKYCVEKGLVNGTSETTFEPSTTTTRGMVMAVLARLAKVDTTGGETWYEKGMAWAVEQGVSDGTNPEAVVTREQLAAMLYRYAKTTAVENGTLDFVDADQTSDWAVDAMTWAVSKGIVLGKGEKTLDPQCACTRAELATMLARFCKL